jgi:tRNA(fMet)-specific endonuclease VapC
MNFSNSYILDSDVLINFLDKEVDFPHNFNKSLNYISIITYYEIMYGAQKRKKKSLFENFIKDTRLQILSLDKTIIDKTLKLRISLEQKGKKLDHMDLFIAATAISYNLTLVTTNQKHFKRIKEIKLFRE